MTAGLDVRPPAVRVVVRRHRFQATRLGWLASGLFLRRTTILEDYDREKQQPAKRLEIHAAMKRNSRSKRKRVRPHFIDYILMKRVRPMTKAAIDATITIPKAPRMMYSQVLEIRVMMEGSRFTK